MTAGTQVDRRVRTAAATSGERLRHTWLIGRREALELIAAWAGLVVIGVAFGEFVLRHDEDNALTRLDDRVEDWFVVRRTPTWDSFSWLGSMLADTVVKVAVTAVVGVVMLRVWRRWLEPTMVAMTLVLEAAAFITITEIVGRPRPDVPKLEGSPVDSSFPSGHTAAGAAYAAIAVVFAWRQREAIARALFAVVALIVMAVGASRMYRGMHHFSDVVAGAVLGTASVAIVAMVVRSAETRRAPASPDPASGRPATEIPAGAT